MSKIGRNKCAIYVKWKTQLQSVQICDILVAVAVFESDGSRAFSVAAPKLWNNLPANIRTTSALGSFKGKLKTHLFQEAFL